MSPPRIGVLALQGGFAAHVAAFARSGVVAREVRRAAELGELDGLALPGGESTTLLNLMRDEPWFDELRRFHQRGGALLATCAGAILLAREVRAPAQPSLGLVDAVVERNAWGRQIDSFEAVLDVEGGGEPPLPAVFIRAPRIVELGPGVSVLARFRGEPVLLRDERVLAATYHPELTGDARVHGRFIEIVVEPRGATTGAVESIASR